MDQQSEELYKTFIDDLVRLRPCVDTRRINGDGWPKNGDPENEKINKVLSELTPEQKEVFAMIAQSARDGGIHDVLVYLGDEINLDGLQIVKNGVKMAKEPFGSDMHFDWVCRREGDPWPNDNKE